MTLVRFFKADGTLDKEVEAAPGQRLLDVAWAAREPLEGACEGVMACSTCHVIVDAEDFARLPPASEEEEDLLDLAAHATRTSRLACQIMLTDDIESLTCAFRRARPTGWGASRSRRKRDADARVGRVFGRLTRAGRTGGDEMASSSGERQPALMVAVEQREARDRRLPELRQRYRRGRSRRRPQPPAPGC